MYRITLSQIAAQQSAAAKQMSDPSDSIIADHQDDIFPVEVSAAIDSTRKTFGVLANVVNSFGAFKIGNQQYRTYVRPHPTEDGAPAPSGGTRRRAVPRQRLLPNPYRVTIQTLREVALALADPATPFGVRLFFRENNPIPLARWSDDSILLNPDEIAVDDYFNSRMFKNDVDVFRRFTSAAGAKISTLLTDVPLSGSASHATLVSAFQLASCRLEFADNCDFLQFPSEADFRSQFVLSDQEFLVGALSLTGEDELQSPTAFRDPTISTSRICFNWPAMVNDCLVKR